MMECMRKDSDVYNRILEAANELFAEKGFAAATTRQIAELAGISRGHLRYYFGKKEELFFSYFSELRDKLWDRAVKQCGEIEDIRIFAMVLLRCYTGLICSFSSVKDLETLQSYEILSNYENKADAMVGRICTFAEEKALKVDKERLFASTEIAKIILYKFAFDRLNQHREGLEAEAIWRYSAMHGLFSCGVSRDEIEALLSTAAHYIEVKHIDTQE